MLRTCCCLVIITVSVKLLALQKFSQPGFREVVRFLSGTQKFSLSYARIRVLSILLSHFITELKIHHLYSLIGHHIIDVFSLQFRSPSFSEREFQKGRQAEGPRNKFVFICGQPQRIGYICRQLLLFTKIRLFVEGSWFSSTASTCGVNFNNAGQ